VIIYIVIREKQNIEVLFSRYQSVRTTRDNDHTYTQTNRHKKKEKRRSMNEWMNEKWMKQQTNKTNQNSEWENTRTNIHTRTRAYTLKGYKPMMMIKTRETHIYQESDVVTGVDDANLCVLVGGCIRWSWTNCTSPHDDGVCFVGTGDDGWTVKDDDDCCDADGGGGVDGIIYDWWCEGKNDVAGERTNVDDDFV